MSGLFYNRRGEKYLSIWMFAVWMVVGVAVVAGFTMFFSDAFDVREIDSKIMLDKVEDCVQNSGILNDELLKGDYDLIKCGFREIWFDDEIYFILVKISGDGNYVYRAGNFAFEKDCEVGGGMLRAKSFPRCSEKKFVLKDVNGKEYKVEILTASNANGGKSI